MNIKCIANLLRTNIIKVFSLHTSEVLNIHTEGDSELEKKNHLDLILTRNL